MAGVLNFLITLRVVGVVVAVVVVVVLHVDVAEVKTWSVMNVVKLVILLGSVACGLVLEAWEVGAAEALVLDIVEAQVMAASKFLFMALVVCI